MPKTARTHAVADFVEILAEVQSPLIGGQAVNLWAGHFQQEDAELRKLAPFLSRDCDLFGNDAVLYALARKTGGTCTLTKPGSASPVVGFLRVSGPSGDDLLIEVLHSVRGLTTREIVEGVAKVDIGGRILYTLSPIALLKAKIANASEFSQSDRQDIHHVKILVRCVGAYIAQAVKTWQRGRLSERGLVKMLQRCWVIVSAPSAKRIAAEHGIDMWVCFPPALRRIDSPKVRGFIEHRLAQK